MAYTPPSGTSADFELGLYIPPTGTNANFDFSEFSPTEFVFETTGQVDATSEIGFEVTGAGTPTEFDFETHGKEDAVTEIGFELTGSIFIPATASLRIVAVDEDGDPLGEFDTFTGLKFGKRHNNYGMCEFKVLATDPKTADLIALRKYSIEIYLDENGTSTRVWAGEQAMRKGSLENDGSCWVTIFCYTWMEQLKDRFTVYEKAYEGIDQGGIIWDLINTTQNDGPNADFGFVEGEIETTVLRDKVFHNETVLEAMQSIMNVLDGLDVEILDDKSVNAATIIGRDLTDEIVLEYGTNVEKVEVIEDFIRPTNRAIVLGNVIGEENLQRIEVDDVGLQAEYKLREQRYSEMEDGELETFQDRGLAYIRKNGSPLMKINITLSKASGISISSIKTGDLVSLIVQKGIYDIDEDYRIFEWELTYNDDNSQNIEFVLGNFLNSEA